VVGPVVGMVGGGQLARMTAQAAIGLGVGFQVLADSAADSAAQVTARTRLGEYRSLADLRDFAAGCDVLTFDHEHVPGEHLAAVEQAGVRVRPSAAALRFTQDKLAMRERLTRLGIACPRFAPVSAITSRQTPSRWTVCTTGYTAPCPCGERAASTASSRSNATYSSAISPMPCASTACACAAEPHTHTPLPS